MTLADPVVVFLQMVNLLLSKGANLSAKDKKERQAIHWAAYLGKWCHTAYIFTQIIDFSVRHTNIHQETRNLQTKKTPDKYQRIERIDKHMY